MLYPPLVCSRLAFVWFLKALETEYYLHLSCLICSKENGATVIYSGGMKCDLRWEK